ncbi:L-threonylcarbamoyladenylate synthase [Paenibacillus aquistagni]|uniref:L-threonylcarbamoyladenylate synthase n=1 Tax=Paenibacillus aquistagni TaxID=1852522 RepID=UPI002165AE5D|nr:L-threonylcarbamoyladenylate synthase [Paenibacillus aquistagni]
MDNNYSSHRCKKDQPPLHTKMWVMEQQTQEEQKTAIQEAADLLHDGCTVAFPTETVYGLGADATSTAAVERIFAAKGRPSDNPLIVHIAERKQVKELVADCPFLAEQLMDACWPGPLTLVLPVREGAVSDRVTAGLGTVGIRMPDHALALQLIQASGRPIAAPSANRSGRPSPTRAAHVLEDLGGRIAGIVDGGATGVGVESTVVEVKGDHIHVLRPGGITVSMLRSFTPNVTIDPAVDPERALSKLMQSQSPEPAASKEPDQTAMLAPRSPGMKYTHYAPKGKLQLVQGASDIAVSAYILEDLRRAKQQGEKTGVLAFAEHVGRYQADVVVELGSLTQLEQGAHRLYDALRHFDEEGATYILAETCSYEGMGLALMNRLLKAAGHHVIVIAD